MKKIVSKLKKDMLANDKDTCFCEGNRLAINVFINTFL